jgi:arylsulfatase A-like enzyme
MRGFMTHHSAHPYRRIALALAALSVTLLGFDGGATAAPDRLDQLPQARPNILLIVTDDQREATLNVMPSTRRLIEERGRSYSEAFATSPLCCPSRASIMTGRYPHNHEVRRNEDAEQLIQESTIQYYLQQNGYRTGIVGKYLNSWDEETQDPPYFDRWAVIDDSSYQHVYTDFLANVNGHISFPSGYSTTFVADQSVKFLRQFDAEDKTPWFLYVAPFASHKPFQPENRYRDVKTPLWLGNAAVAETDRTDKPPWVQARHVRFAGGRSIARHQYKTLYSADDMVERIFRVLKARQETRDTLVIFISDNGYMWGEHGVAAKRFPYTQAVRVPLIVRWPGVVPEGESDPSLVGNIDIAPTVLEAAGVAPNPDYPIDGRSLLTSEPRRELLLEYFGSRLGEDLPAWASTRSLTNQYIEYYDPLTGTTEFTEYYDLIEDPWQLVNLLGDSDPTNDPPVALLSLDLQQTRECSGADCP